MLVCKAYVVRHLLGLYGSDTLCAPGFPITTGNISASFLEQQRKFILRFEMF